MKKLNIILVDIPADKVLVIHKAKTQVQVADFTPSFLQCCTVVNTENFPNVLIDVVNDLVPEPELILWLKSTGQAPLHIHLLSNIRKGNIISRINNLKNDFLINGEQICALEEELNTIAEGEIR